MLVSVLTQNGGISTNMYTAREGVVVFGMEWGAFA